MGFAEVYATRSAAPPQPRLANSPGRAGPRSVPLTPQVTHTQQRSNHRRFGARQNYCTLQPSDPSWIDSKGARPDHSSMPAYYRSERTHSITSSADMPTLLRDVRALCWRRSDKIRRDGCGRAHAPPQAGRRIELEVLL